MVEKSVGVTESKPGVKAKIWLIGVIDPFMVKLYWASGSAIAVGEGQRALQVVKVGSNDRVPRRPDHHRVVRVAGVEGRRVQHLAIALADAEQTRHVHRIEIARVDGRDHIVRGGIVVPGEDLAGSLPGGVVAFALGVADLQLVLRVEAIALRLGPTTFGIFDAFTDEAGRQAHLNGPIAQALMAQASELLSQAPSIEPIEVLGAKLPG